MSDSSKGLLQRSIWAKLVWIVVYLALFLLPNHFYTRWIGPFDWDTFRGMGRILLVGMFAVVYLRKPIKWEYVTFFAITALVLASEHIVSLTFWRQVFHAPMKVVLYWIACLAFLVLSWIYMPRSEPAGQSSEPQGGLSKRITDWAKDDSEEEADL